MDTLTAVAHGFSVVLQPQNLLLCAVGCLWGTVVGVLPGLGPLAGLTLLLPFTFYLEPAAGIIMLSGIFCGAMYGGSTTSILLRIPGEAASVVTCIDGYEMARKGRAGPALAIAALVSWLAGTASVVGLTLFGPPLAAAMLTVGPSAEFLLMLFALAIVTMVSFGSRLKAAIMVLAGLLIGTIGMDTITATPRFTFGQINFYDGISFPAIAIGLFGISEVLLTVERLTTVKPIVPTFSTLIPTRKDLREATPPAFRGTLIGFVFGLIPGASHIVSTFVSYSLEKRISRKPWEFGKGAVAGVAGPEAANNATTGSGMIPLLVLGIPALPATAILLSALMIHGVQPGPQLIVEHPDIFWGVIASLYVGNLILLILNLPLVGLFVNLLRIPYGYLAPVTLILCIIGIYSINSSQIEIVTMVIFGCIGYILRKLSYDVTPFLMAIVLGNPMEEALRRSLLISNGDYRIFFDGVAPRVILGLMVLVCIIYIVALRYGVDRTLNIDAMEEMTEDASTTGTKESK